MLIDSISSSIDGCSNFTCQFTFLIRISTCRQPNPRESSRTTRLSNSIIPVNVLILSSNVLLFRNPPKQFAGTTPDYQVGRALVCFFLSALANLSQGTCTSWYRRGIGVSFHGTTRKGYGHKRYPILSSHKSGNKTRVDPSYTIVHQPNKKLMTYPLFLPPPVWHRDYGAPPSPCAGILPSSTWPPCICRRPVRAAAAV